MRAAVVHRYGGPEVARVAEVADPAVGRRQVRVRVVAAAVTSGDARIRGARFPAGFAPLARLALGLRGPRRHVLGVCFSGVVDAVGADVEGFAPGDEVCGMSGARMGAHAEHVVVPASRLARKPAGVTHDDAAGLLFGGSTALHFLRDKAKVRPGASVLVNGASGAVGSNAVQIAKHLGATVTAVTSGANAELVTRLGADRVVDHTRADVTALPDRYDVVLDTVGNLSIGTGRRLMREGGVLALVAASLGETLRARGDVVAGPSSERAESFALLLQLLADGEITVVHDRAFALDDIAGAYRRVDTGHKVGNVLVHP
jgi:NADPH:quinone reductase-like Zn-dependent oxidoreductase